MRTSGQGREQTAPSARQRLGLGAGCVVLYIALDLALRALALPGSRIIPWYPPAGLAFAALVLAGPIAAVPLFLTRLALGLPYSPSAPFLPTAVEAALLVLSYTAAAAFVRRRLSTDEHSWDLPDAARMSGGLLAAAIASGATSALVGVIWRKHPSSEFWANTMSFAAGDASGALVVAPLVLLVLTPWISLRIAGKTRVVDAARSAKLAMPDGPKPPSRTPGRRRAEQLGQALSVLAVMALAITDHRRAGLPLSFLCFAPLIWVALREGVRGAAIVIAAFGVGFATLGLWFGLTPVQLQSYQSLLIALGVTGLFVGAVRTSAVESNALYWHLVATANEAIWRLDPAGRTVHVNARLATLLGCTAESLIGRSALEFIAPEERERWVAERRKRRAGLDGLYETSVLRPDGERRRVLVSASQVRSATDGAVLGSVAMITDITALRDAERQRNEAQRGEERAQVLLEVAFRSARDAMVLFRASDEEIIDVNNEWSRVTGYKREDAVGRSQKELRIWGPADSARVAQGIAEHGAVHDLEIAFQRHLPDGSTEMGTALLSAQPAWLSDTLYFLVTGRDITDEKRVAQHRIQLQRLEELGRLAGGIAHDFNNLLTVVRSYAQMIRQTADAGEPVQPHDALEIERAADRGRALTSRLLAFSRNQSVEARLIDLNAALRAADGMLRPLLGTNIEIDYDLTDGLPLITADAGQLDQVLLNFAVNARDAMSDTGRLTFGTRVVNVAHGEAAATLGADALPGDYVVLDVTDTGAGMDDVTSARIFEPFFSTKGPGRGTGLGLAVVFGIVRQAHGAIRVRSAPGRGTTFTVYWPSTTYSVEIAGGLPDRGAPVMAPYRAASILLVDDEDALRTVVRKALERDGHRVTEARNGRDAIARLDAMHQQGQEVDLVLSDVVMPQMNGRQLAEHLAVHQPEVRVVLMSGYTDERARGSGPESASPPILGKPFDLPVLLAVVRTALSAPAGVLAPLTAPARN